MNKMSKRREKRQNDVFKLFLPRKMHILAQMNQPQIVRVPVPIPKAKIENPLTSTNSKILQEKVIYSSTSTSTPVPVQIQTQLTDTQSKLKLVETKEGEVAKIKVNDTMSEKNNQIIKMKNKALDECSATLRSQEISNLDYDYVLFAKSIPLPNPSFLSDVKRSFQQPPQPTSAIVSVNNRNDTNTNIDPVPPSKNMEMQKNGIPTVSSNIKDINDINNVSTPDKEEKSTQETKHTADNDRNLNNIDDNVGDNDDVEDDDIEWKQQQDEHLADNGIIIINLLSLPNRGSKNKESNLLNYQFQWPLQSRGFYLKNRETYLIIFDILIIQYNSDGQREEDKYGKIIDEFKSVDKIVTIDKNNKIRSSPSGPILKRNNFLDGMTSTFDLDCNFYDPETFSLVPIIRYFPIDQSSTDLVCQVKVIVKNQSVN